MCILVVDLCKDLVILIDVIKVIFFFSGFCVVFVEDVIDIVVLVIFVVFEDWFIGDVQIVVIVGQFKVSFKICKVFEIYNNVYVIVIYNDLFSCEDIEVDFFKVGLIQIDCEVMIDFINLVKVLDSGDFCQMLEKFVFYKYGDVMFVIFDDVVVCVLIFIEVVLDDMFNIVVEGCVQEIGFVMVKFKVQGMQFVGFCIGVICYFCVFYVVVLDSGGVF